MIISLMQEDTFSSQTQNSPQPQTKSRSLFIVRARVRDELSSPNVHVVGCKIGLCCHFDINSSLQMQPACISRSAFAEGTTSSEACEYAHEDDEATHVSDYRVPVDSVPVCDGSG